MDSSLLFFPLCIFLQVVYKSEARVPTTTAASPGPGCDTINLSNGRVTYNKGRVGRKYPTGTVVTHSCNRGWMLDGPERRSCQNNGRWTGWPAHSVVDPFSPPPPPPPPPPKKGCFPSTARVSLENGKLLTMSELQVGDRVQTVSQTGKVEYNEVVVFLEKQPNKITQYRSVTTSGKENLLLTGNHLLYSKKDFDEKFMPIYADQLLIGDEVLIEQNDEIIPIKVDNVSNLMMQGIFAPLTKEGNIVVDGVLASCYADVPHDFGHLSMMPIQWFGGAIEQLFGCDIAFPVYVNIAIELSFVISDGQF